eukprot:403330677
MSPNNLKSQRQTQRSIASTVTGRPQSSQNYRLTNKQLIKQIEQDVQQHQKQQLQAAQEDVELFKMQRFKNVPSKLADQISKDKSHGKNYDQHLETQHKQQQSLLEQKHFIKRNMRQVDDLSKETHQFRQIESKVLNSQKQQQENRKYGTLPKYLVQFKKQEELEIQQTLKEIEMNKRPSGTKILDDSDRQNLLTSLLIQEQNLKNQIERVCISQQTERAKNQYRGLESELKQLQENQSPSKYKVGDEPPKVEWVCTIFSVFLCSECAGMHRKLGRQLSEIKSIKFLSPYQSQMWTEKEIRQLAMTEGNIRFRDFLLPYNVEFQGLLKYKTRAAILYLNDISRKMNFNSSGFMDVSHHDEIALMIDNLSTEQANQMMFENSADDDRLQTFEDSEVGSTVLSYDIEKDQEKKRKIHVMIIDPNDDFSQLTIDRQMQNQQTLNSFIYRSHNRYKTVKVVDMQNYETSSQQIIPSDLIPKKSHTVSPLKGLFNSQEKHEHTQTTQKHEQSQSSSAFFNGLVSQKKSIEKIFDKSVEGLKKIEMKELEQSMVNKGRQLLSKFF